MSAEPGTSQNLFDRISHFTGTATAWLTLFMVLLTAVIVVMRYVFDAGMIWMQESVTWMHAAVFMLGASYTLLHEDHVRIEPFSRCFSLLDHFKPLPEMKARGHAPLEG